MCGFFPLMLINSPTLQTATRCPKILNSDTLRPHRLKGSVSQDGPHLTGQLHILGLQVTHTSLWLVCTVRGFPQHRPFRLDNVLEWLAELRKTLYLLLLVCHKGYNSGIVKWKRCTRQVVGGGCGAFMAFSDASPVHTPMCSPTCRSLCGGCIM